MAVNKRENVVLGAGVAGLAAGHILTKHGLDTVIYDRNEVAGGLCRSFCVDGFTFDTFAHVNFSKDEYVMSMLEEKTPYLTHIPEATNYYQGRWIRNPAQNNLIDLEVEERIRIIKDFIERKDIPVKNYEDWLRYQYGDYFAEHFPTCYTRKYWTVEPRELEVKWVEGRMYKPSIEEVLRGAMTHNTPNVHYSKEMHYPKEGGYQAFLMPFVKGQDIRLRKKVIGIDQKRHIVEFEDGECVEYKNLISTIPLNEVVLSMKEVPEKIKQAANNLDYTAGVMVSIGLRCENVAPALWFYIYDEEILPARVYAPNIKSPRNVPEGCCALQAEIYFSNRKPLVENLEKLKKITIQQLIKMGLFREQDIIVTDVRYEPYANIMFTPSIYQARNMIHEYLQEQNIIYAGRFGEWDYLWTGQAILSGKGAAEIVLENK